MASRNKPQDMAQFFAETGEVPDFAPEAPQQRGFVLDFTRPPDELIPAQTTVNCAITSARASNYNGVVQMSIRFTVADGDYEGRGFFENIQIARVTGQYLEQWYDQTGKTAEWKLARVLDAVQFDGNRRIGGEGEVIDTEEALINWLNELGEKIKGLVVVITVNQWGGGTDRVDPQTGEPYKPRNGIAKIAPFGTARKASDMFVV